LKEYSRLKPPANDSASDVQIPIQKHKKYKKTSQNDFSKVNNSIIMNINKNEMDEITVKEFKTNDYMNDS
jgi:hypothetical protein